MLFMSALFLIISSFLRFWQVLVGYVVLLQAGYSGNYYIVCFPYFYC